MLIYLISLAYFVKQKDISIFSVIKMILVSVTKLWNHITGIEHISNYIPKIPVTLIIYSKIVKKIF